jgi:hypothetical protein
LTAHSLRWILLDEGAGALDFEEKPGMEAREQHSATPTQEPPEEAKSPEEIALELGPFNPPPDFRFGEEFDSAPPRPIPPRLKQGSYTRQWRQRAWASLTAAAACYFFSLDRFTQELSYYVLALGYLGWAGTAILAFLSAAALHRLLTGGRFSYVRNGIPVVARVLESTVHLKGNQRAQSFGFATLVEYRHPETGQWTRQWTRTHPVDSAAKVSRYSTSVRAGDYVTVVACPGKFEKSLALYGYLGLDPDQDFIRKDGRPVEAPPTWVVLGVMLLVAALMGAAVLFLYAIEFLVPEGGSFTLAGIVAGAGVVAGGLAGAVLRRRKSASPAEEDRGRGRRRLKRLGVGSFFGAFAGLLVAVSLNAGLDRSPPSFRDIEVVKFWQETWYPLFVRQYQIEYVEKDGGKRKKISARLETMRSFSLGLGVIEVGKGWLGMEWVRGIHPLGLRPLEAGEPEGKNAITLELKTPGDRPQSLVLKPVLSLGEGKSLEPSDWLTERVRKVAERRSKDGEAAEEAERGGE